MKKETKWLYIFILLNPIFDLLSSIFNQMGFRFTPSTFLRPIIPLILLIYIFILDKSIRKKLIGISLIYISYAFIHLILYSGLITEFSYGTLMHEFQYIANYTYLMFTLFTFIYMFYKKETMDLKKYLFYISTFYVLSIYVAILTGTSLTSYVEGVGFKGWFNTSGAVGAILTLTSFINIPYLIKSNINKIYKFIYIFLTLFYLHFLIGSRVGLMGSLLFIVSYIGSTILIYLLNQKKIKIRDYIKLEVLLPMIMVLILSLFIDSSTLSRRAQLDDMKDEDKYIAYDLKDEIDKIDKEESTGKYILNEQKMALDSLEEYANATKLANVNLRKQQIIYHYYLWSFQNNILLKLFGNGFLTNMGMLTLEMESFALFFNFGLIGFILYYLPFILILTYGIYIGIKNYKKLDLEYLMLILGSITSFGISTLSGHTYFNTSVMPVIIILYVVLINKIIFLKGDIK